MIEIKATNLARSRVWITAENKVHCSMVAGPTILSVELHPNDVPKFVESLQCAVIDLGKATSLIRALSEVIKNNGGILNGGI